MTDKDRYVDETLKKQIQDAYGASDEQLEARMDRIEKTLTDDEFAGAEDRIMAKLMARIGAPEQKEETAEVETVKVDTVKVVTVVSEVDEAAVDTDLKTDESSSEAAEETSATVVAEEEKVVRFGRKKVLLVAALVATFIGALAVTTIGENSYFFREDERREDVIFDSGKNISDVSSLEEAYQKIKKEFDRTIFALNHIPKDAELVSLILDAEKARIELKNNDNYLYFIQWKRNEEASINMGSDRHDEYIVRNEWLNKEIVYSRNKLEDNTYEYEAELEEDGMAMIIFGKSSKEEFEEILRNLYFY